MQKILFFYFTLILIIICPKVNAQNKATLKGTVKNEQGQVVPGVHIINVTGSQATTSNRDGKYLIHYDTDKKLKLQFTHIRYQTFEKNFILKDREAQVYNPTLKKKTQRINEVDITAQSKIQTKGIYLQTKEIDKIASVGGESIENLLKTLPGVSSNNELSSQYSV